MDENPRDEPLTLRFTIGLIAIAALFLLLRGCDLIQ